MGRSAPPSAPAASAPPALLDLHRDPELVLGVDRVPERAGLGVAGPVDACRPAVRAGDHSAALVGDLLPGVSDDLIEKVPVDPHAPRLADPRYTAAATTWSQRIGKIE